MDRKPADRGGKANLPPGRQVLVDGATLDKVQAVVSAQTGVPVTYRQAVGLAVESFVKAKGKTDLM